MKHFVKIPSLNSDLFISKLTGNKISYQVRDKESGKLLEPIRSNIDIKISPEQQLVYFDKRNMPIQFAAQCKEILESQ